MGRWGGPGQWIFGCFPRVNGPKGDGNVRDPTDSPVRRNKLEESHDREGPVSVPERASGERGLGVRRLCKSIRRGTKPGSDETSPTPDESFPTTT